MRSAIFMCEVSGRKTNLGPVARNARLVAHVAQQGRQPSALCANGSCLPLALLKSEPDRYAASRKPMSAIPLSANLLTSECTCVYWGAVEFAKTAAAH